MWEWLALFFGSLKKAESAAVAAGSILALMATGRFLGVRRRASEERWREEVDSSLRAAEVRLQNLAETQESTSEYVRVLYSRVSDLKIKITEVLNVLDEHQRERTRHVETLQQQERELKSLIEDIRHK